MEEQTEYWIKQYNERIAFLEETVASLQERIKGLEEKVDKPDPMRPSAVKFEAQE